MTSDIDRIAELASQGLRRSSGEGDDWPRQAMAEILATEDPIATLARVVPRLGATGSSKLLKGNLATLRSWGRDDYLRLASLVRHDELARYYVAAFLSDLGGIPRRILIGLGLADPPSDSSDPDEPIIHTLAFGHGNKPVFLDLAGKLRLWERFGMDRGEILAFRAHLAEIFPSEDPG